MKKSSNSSTVELLPIEDGSLALFNERALVVDLISVILDEVIFFAAFNPDYRIDDNILINELYQISKYQINRNCVKNEKNNL